MSDMDEMIRADRFDPTFSGSRQERRWIRDSLSELWEDGWFTDVLYRVAGGKEATVYCCRAHPKTGATLVAAKVYRPRMFRAMRNDSTYKQGRGLVDAEGKSVFDRRSRLALRKRTAYGKALDAAAWCGHEAAALAELHAAGADVPKPLVSTHNAILMEFVGDEDGPAPLLKSVHPTREEATRLLDRLVENLEVFLRCFRVHGDLSPYNVMVHRGELRVIDLPQAVDALRHPEAFSLFRRDVTRLTDWFARKGVQREAGRLSDELWQRHLS